MEKTTLNRLLKERFEQSAARPALGWKQGNEYRFITYTDLTALLTKFAAGLISLGIQPGERVAMLSENRYEWAVSDLGILSAGAVHAPMFSTLPPKQVEYIVNDSGARMLIVSDPEQFAKAVEVKPNAPALERVLVMDDTIDLTGRDWAMRWADVLARGEQLADAEERVDARANAVEPDDLASLIYTSGTTGEPKGAMLTHNNFASNAIAAAKVLDLYNTDVFLSLLPLAHVFERLAGHYLALYVGASIGYAESLRTIKNNVIEVRPTVLLGVPRIWEMFMDGIIDRGKRMHGKERAIFEWALGVASKVGRTRLRRKPVMPWDALSYKVADRLVLQKIRAGFGGRLRLSIAGGAALPPVVGEFFFGIGIMMLEGFGLTETSPVICVSRPPLPAMGTVGPPVEHVEVKIAEDGEILARGPNIMQGYWNKPEATKEAIDDDGWFHTGDIGVFAEGNLKITGRKKDILVLRTGKKVAPALVETTLLRSPYINQVVVFGDKQSSVTALVVPDMGALKEWARQNDVAGDDASLLKEQKVSRLIREQIDGQSDDLADFERVRRFSLLLHEFTMARGEMTPTLKIKRKAVEEKYKDLIAAMAD